MMIRRDCALDPLNKQHEKKKRKVIEKYTDHHGAGKRKREEPRSCLVHHQKKKKRKEGAHTGPRPREKRWTGPHQPVPSAEPKKKKEESANWSTLEQCDVVSTRRGKNPNRLPLEPGEKEERISRGSASDRTCATPRGKRKDPVATNYVRPASRRATFRRSYLVTRCVWEKKKKNTGCPSGQRVKKGDGSGW